MNHSALPVDQLWTDLSATSTASVRHAVAAVVHEAKAKIALSFYQFMMEDPGAAPFLSVKTVEERLKPGMERWLEALFCHGSVDELGAVIAMQRHVGEVHARAAIPVNLVARGMRLIKREIVSRLLQTDLNRDELIAAVLHTDRLIDIAFEEMSTAFVQSHESGVKTDEAYRMFAAGSNLAVEREKQMGTLLEWENRLFRVIATEMPFDELTSLNSSTFGLWLHHKAPLIFDKTRELAIIDDCLKRIDETLLPQFVRRRDNDLATMDVRALVKAMMSEMEQLKFLLSSMFERLTDLEIGRDVLTQLFNRRFLQTIVKREIELSRSKGTQFYILMIDIDFFKRVNDADGHETGDRVLQQVAGLLVSQVRASDFVFRYGGEEFLIVLAEVSEFQALSVAEKIRSKAQALLIPHSDQRSIQVTLSIGIAAFDGHPDYLRVVDRADKALYLAKHQGRNRCVLARE